MKNILLILFTYIFVHSSYGQINNNVYKNDESYIEFKDNTFSFNLTINDCLTHAISGNGRYEILDSYLLFHTEEFLGKESSYEIINSNNKLTSIQINDQFNNPMPYAVVELLNKNGKIIGEHLPSEMGFVVIKDIDSIDKIHIFSIGYMDVSLDYKKGAEYLTSLMFGKKVEYQTVVFQIKLIENNKISLILLSKKFKNYKKRKLKALKKLSAKQKKDRKIFFNLTL